MKETHMFYVAIVIAFSVFLVNVEIHFTSMLQVKYILDSMDLTSWIFVHFNLAVTPGSCR